MTLSAKYQPPGSAETADVVVGATYVAPSGRLWTVRSITPRGRRYELIAPSPDGAVGMIVDLGALQRMVRVDASHIAPVSEPRSLDEQPQASDTARTVTASATNITAGAIVT